MKVEYVNPFIEGVYEVFERMVQASVERGDVGMLDETGINPRDLTALVGLSGSVRGTVTLAFPVGTAIAVVKRLLGSDITVIDDTVSDALAELAQMIARQAQEPLASALHGSVRIAMPVVVRGGKHYIEGPDNAHWLEVPFSSDLGPFTLRVSFEKAKEDGRSAPEEQHV